MPFNVIDLFAGPGGLGEGFSALDGGKTFQTVVSAEMEVSAHKTLTLRSFFRHARNAADSQPLSAYYGFCNSATEPHPEIAAPSLWKLATSEAKLLTLGQPADNETLDKLIEAANLREEETVVIGGPPCQAYSLVGRSRNMGKGSYVAADDHRHFLYREYLRILHKARPAVFVMENVKGILSSKIDDRLIFREILSDLTDPGKALGKGSGLKYTIHSLVADTCFTPEMDPTSIDPRSFIVHAERFGIPQARHRVILLGVRADMHYDGRFRLETAGRQLTVKMALRGLPRLRSKLGQDDGPIKWRQTVAKVGRGLYADALKKDKPELAAELISAVDRVSLSLSTGALRQPRPEQQPGTSLYEHWVQDSKVQVWLNNETRPHMQSDLGRYFYASIFGQLNDYSPKGHAEFALEGLAPDHANWKTGKFADRFRVQLYTSPSTTVTSHISKDGHYFIHPDPLQCRSFTVREAARLQTFPDNYFFQGNRTQQYHQVGNAVPSLLANQIAKVVAKIMCNSPATKPI